MPYDDYNQCIEILSKRTPVIKHNYSNNKAKDVDIWVSKDGLTLYYKNVKRKNKILCGLGAKKSINLKTIEGFFFGAGTSTF